jgi:hypothetical protein
MSTLGTPGRISAAKRVLEEHKELHSRLERIEAALAARPPSEDSAGWLAALVSQLQDVLPLLQAHFAYEEDAGLFERIVETWPETSRACARLRGEHGALLARFDRLRADATTGPTDEGALRRLTAEGRSLLGSLAHHEESENELLLRSIDDAVAAQD